MSVLSGFANVSASKYTSKLFRSGTGGGAIMRKIFNVSHLETNSDMECLARMHSMKIESHWGWNTYTRRIGQSMFRHQDMPHFSDFVVINLDASLERAKDQSCQKLLPTFSVELALPVTPPRTLIVPAETIRKSHQAILNSNIQLPSLLDPVVSTREPATPCLDATKMSGGWLSWRGVSKLCANRNRYPIASTIQ